MTAPHSATAPAVSVLGHGVPTLLLVAALVHEGCRVTWRADDPTYGRPDQDMPILLTHAEPGRPGEPPRIAGPEALQRFEAWLARIAPSAPPPLRYDVHLHAPPRPLQILPQSAAILSALDLWRHARAVIDSAGAGLRRSRRHDALRITVLPTPTPPSRITTLPSAPGAVAAHWRRSDMTWRFSWQRRQWASIPSLHAWGAAYPQRSGLPVLTAPDAWILDMRAGRDIVIWLRDLSALIHLPIMTDAVLAALRRDA